MSHRSSRVVSDEAIAAINQRIAADIQTDQQAEAATRNQGTVALYNVPVQRPQIPTHLPALPNGRHKVGHACPNGNGNCHFHYSSGPCHKPWETCDTAIRAIKSSFYAKNFWSGAPLGWNEQHDLCIAPGARPNQMCDGHYNIYADSLPSHERQMLNMTRR